MRALRVVAMVLGGLIALVVIGLLAVWLLVDPNDYKDRIARAVKASTGRELALPGKIKLSVFPWIALELGPAILGNPPGFGAEPFAAVKHAALRVRLLPLFRKQLQIGRIEIDGLDLRLRKNAAGKGNWESAGSSAAPASSSSGAQGLEDLAGIEISDSRLAYQDLLAEHVNLEVGRVAMGVAVPIKIKLTLTTGAGAQPIELAGQFAATLDMDRKQYHLASVDLEGAFGGGSGTSRVPWKFSAAQLDLDLDAQTLSAPSLKTQLGAAHLGASLKGSKVIDAPSLSGAFKLEPLAPRELMGQFGITAPKTRDAKALAKLSASGEFAYRSKQVAVSQLDVQLDDSRLRGSAAISNLDTKAMNFDLTLDRIDLDRYRSPPESAARPAAQAPEKPAAAASDPLKTLQMTGTFALGTAICAGMTLTELRVNMVAKDGVTHVAPVTAKLYGGDYTGDITLDDRGPLLAMKLEQSMTGVDVAQLLKDLAKSKLVSGRGMITTDLTAHGSGDALLKSLNGHVAATLDNGAVEGIDLWFEINRAIALIQKQPLPGGSSSGRTKFDTFKATADLSNGVAATKDLNIASQNLRVTGQGSTNLLTQAVDYQVKATVLKEAPGSAHAPAATLADIPLTITGPMTGPKVRPDLEGLAKARVQQELDKHKDELKRKLQDKFRDLLK